MSNRRVKPIAAGAIACVCVLLLALAFAPRLLAPASAEPATAAPAATATASEDASASSAGGDASSAASGAAYEPGVVVVSLAPGAAVGQLQEAIDSVPGLAGASVSEQSNGGLVQVSLPSELGVDQALGLLESLEPVDSAQPNYIYRMQDDDAASAAFASAGLDRAASASVARFVSGTALAGALGVQATANDPAYSKGDQWSLASVNAPAAWDAVSANAAASSAVTVAVLDNGFLATHEDLALHVVDTYNAATGKDVLDTGQSDHGTHVAGIVSAVCNNGKGVASIANNALGLMLVRVSDAKGVITTTTVVDAYDYIVKNAAAHNVRVVNMSLGTDSDTPVSRKSDPALYDAIATARKAGIVTVAAACNGDGDAEPPFYAFPSDFDNVVSVINLKMKAMNPSDVVRDSDSNYNASDQGEAMKAKNISAPGTRIYSTFDTNTSAYAWEGGTSMASPLVAGVFGLMFTVNPGLTAEQAEHLLYNSAKDITSSPAAPGWDHETGYGEVDADAAVKAAGATATAADKTDIATCTITPSDVAYTGSALEPAVKVTNGSTALNLGTDYTVSYRDNKNAGLAAFTVKGIGTYKGIAVGAFSISKTMISSVTLKSASATYNGKSHKPVVKAVRTPSGTVKKPNYTVTYWRGSSKTTDFTSAGEITVKVIGEGNCSGEASAKFTIKPKGTSISKLVGAKKKITVTWKKQAKQASGYQIRFATNKAFTKNVKTVSAKSSTTKKTVKGLKAKKRYYVKIRTYKKSASTRVYSTWSKAKPVKTKS